MATTQHTSAATYRLDVQLALKNGINTETLAGTHTMTARSSTFQRLDPGGAARNVVLPAAGPSYGPFWIQNVADVAAEIITVKQSDGSTTVSTVRPGEVACFIYDTEASLYALFGKFEQPEAVIGASTAAAGSASGDAGVLPAGTSRFYPVTAADGTKGVRIHADDDVIGREIVIINTVNSAVLKVYPPTGGTINGGVADASLNTASGKSMRLVCTAALTWYSVP